MKKERENRHFIASVIGILLLVLAIISAIAASPMDVENISGQG